MNLNNKGFTLIEVLAVIVIITVLGGIAIPNVLKSINTSKETSEKVLKDNIKTAAQQLYEEIEYNDNELYDYTRSSKQESIKISDNVLTIHLQTLIMNGFLGEGDEDSKKLINPVTGEDIGDCIITVKKNVVNDVVNYEFLHVDTMDKCNVDSLNSVRNQDMGNVMDDLSLGYYISMTPSRSAFSTDHELTGYSSNQTINPRELNLWRVIKINSDGSVDVISEYVSSVNVSFQGLTGYKNLVGYLNVLASQYENSAYTSGSRYFGYNGQTEYITDTSKFVISAPWTCSTSSSCNSVESQGGGDSLYLTDVNLLQLALGTKKAYKVGTTTAVNYWVASRHYEYYDTNLYVWGGVTLGYTGNIILPDGDYDLYNYDGKFLTYTISYALRPILTLKAGFTCSSGDGTKDNPCVLK